MGLWIPEFISCLLVTSGENEISALLSEDMHTCVCVCVSEGEKERERCPFGQLYIFGGGGGELLRAPQ